MLSTNVLCIKKRKKRSYCIANRAENGAGGTDKTKRSGAVTMLQITEDTPPDMLAGAMDLTVHLPSGRSVKMSVERSTPMMDLLVQITTNHHLQLSGYTLQALGMAPSDGDSVLPYKPNTPIGALDTQHIRVVPKSRTIPVPKNVPPGHQPFESTFRLKVHLPRNQLYVTRVSQSVLLDDIMKKVCEEKNLDPLKYEFRHPGNLDEILDPKLTLSDYAITEIYLVQKGTTGLNQAFSTSDIMALRKEEERKQMHNKTGGGVFNLIFRRGKSSTGSLSSENRSISPTHSDDSRSVTPPGVQQQIITPPQPEPPTEKPKPPQRKRRPAPKPPQEKLPAELKKIDTGLTICHSRNSSDSSGYHEASILSDNCNTSLPRRPKSTIINEETQKILSDQHSQSTSNLSKMSAQSKSTSSLAFPTRKKKTAPPPPPPVLKPASSETNFQEPSPVVASHPSVIAQETSGNGQDSVVINHPNPTPIPRTRTKIAPVPRPRSIISITEEGDAEMKNDEEVNPKVQSNLKTTDINVTSTENSMKNEKVEENVIQNVVETTRNEDTQETVKIEPVNQKVQTCSNDVGVDDISTEYISKTEETEIKSTEIIIKRNEGNDFTQIEDDIAYMTRNVEFSKKLIIEDSVSEENNNDIEERQSDKGAVPIDLKTNENEDISTLIKENVSERKESTVDKEHSEECTKVIDLQEEVAEIKSDEEKIIQPLSQKEQGDSKRREGEIVETKENTSRKQAAENALQSNLLQLDENHLQKQLTKPETKPVKSEEKPLQKLLEENSSELKIEIVEYHKEDDDQKDSDKNSEEKPLVPSEEKVKPPEVVAFYPKPVKDGLTKTIFDSYSRKRGFQIGSSLLSLQSEEEPQQKKISSDLSTPNSVASALNAFDFVDEIDGVDINMFTGSLSKNSKNKNKIINQLHGMHEFESFKKNPSGGSLRSVSSFPGFLSSNMKKWDNLEELDDISLHSYSGQSGWVLGDTSDTESTASTANTSQRTPFDSLASVQSLPTADVESKPKAIETIIPINVESKNVEENESLKENELETEWQYQLPSPPKAFRDSSPVNFETDTNHESIADSVVTSPELFEKLKVVKDTQSEKETASDITSVMSEEEKPILNKLSLENLEKRKSLVYNRELSTSLKMPDEDRKNDTFASSLTKFEKTYDEVRRSSPKEVLMKSTLPNFKITTYDNPKQKLDIFEDDTVRSNADRGSKRNSFAEPSSTLQKSYVGRSMENISFRKNSGSDEGFKQPNEYTFFKPPLAKAQLNSVFRSESFTKEQTWVPSKPVTRSKSQVALNKYKDNTKVTQLNEENLTKSNSLFDVSGLQSLGVMRLIQNKLNTPNNSSEQLDKEEPSYQEQPEAKSEVQKPVEEKPVKTYQYRVPSINMGTWSERPKIPVNVKEDPDYKFGIKDTNNSKLIVNTVNNDIKSHNSIEVRNKAASTPTSYNGVNLRVAADNNNKNVSIKVNGSEPISGQNTGNIVIKIGGVTQSSNKPVFRKPLGNVNENSPRPHSIAFGSDFDISRVPIVRSVEFKKPYKDFQSNSTNNTSVTQIYQTNNNNKFKTTSLNRNGYSNIEPPVNSTESSKKFITESAKPRVEPKPVFRVNSYLQNVVAPVVRGFRTTNEPNRMSWSQPNSFSTLPSKPKEFNTNSSVPFSQSNLRRTESTKIEKTVPPPVPVMPKGPVKRDNNNCGAGDPKEQLLQAIRDFGGKKGLRAVKA